MAAVLLTPPGMQFFDNNGNPLAGGSLFTYAAGTLTPKTTYTDNTGITPLANPVVLDSAGRATIWIDGAYKFILKDSLGTTITTVDNVSAFNTTGADINGIVPSQTGNSGKALLTNGATVYWGYPGPQTSSFSNKVLNGLTLSNNVADATNDIDIASGLCVSDDGTTIMTLVSGLTKRLDAAWVVGTNQGGLDTGAIADATYYIWVINRTDTDVTDVLFSQSSTSPTMPSGYAKKKLIGSFRRLSGAILSGVSKYSDSLVLSYQIPTTSGTTVEIINGLIPNVRRITIALDGLSTNGTNLPLIQLGTAGSYITAGYSGGGGYYTNINTTGVSLSTAGFVIYSNNAAFVTSGTITLTNVGGNKWFCSGVLTVTSSSINLTISGFVSLGAEITRVRLNTNTADTFDAGNATVTYEFSVPQ